MRHRHSYRGKSRVGRMGNMFKERQVYLRSDGEVQFITLRPWVQATSLLFLLVGLFWLAFATINVVFKDQLLALKERRLYQARLEYEDRITEMRRSIDRLNSKLMLDQNAYLGKVDQVRIEYETLVQQHKRLSEFFHNGGIEGTDTQNGAPPAPGNSAPKDGSKPGRDGGLNDRKVRQTYAAQFRTRSEAEKPLRDMTQQFEGLNRAQIGLLEAAAARLDRQMQASAKVLSRIKLDANKLIAQSDFQTSAIGGPFVAAVLRDDRLGVSMDKVVQRMIRLEKLRHETAKLPLGLPLHKVSRISSGFGPRKDPFRKTMAMHHGVDFKAPYGAPVLTTADGVVTKAGWEGAYGKLVEIRHDNGVTTRYAHLRSVAVTHGQRVTRNQKIGRLGNTGRSTGAHLHYETRVQGRALNPVRFWKARDALQRTTQ